MKTLANYGNEYVHADCVPDLHFDCVLGNAVEGLDPQMLLDPFEKQFDLPATSIEFGNGESRLHEVVGDEDQPLVGLNIEVADPAYRFGIVFDYAQSGQSNSLIETQPLCLVDGTGITAPELRVPPGTGHEEGGALMDSVQSGEVPVSFVHDVEGSGIENDVIQEIDIVHTGRCYAYYTGKMTPERKDCIQLDASVVSSELGPWKQRKAQVDDGGIQCVCRMFQFDSEAIAGIQIRGLVDQNLSEICKYAPVSFFVGIGQGAPSNSCSNTAVIKLGAHRSQARLYISQTLSAGQLGESHDQKLVVTAHGSYMAVAPISLDTLVELVLGNPIHQLCKHSSSFVHESSPCCTRQGEPCKKALLN